MCPSFLRMTSSAGWRLAKSDQISCGGLPLALSRPTRCLHLRGGGGSTTGSGCGRRHRISSAAGTGFLRWRGSMDRSLPEPVGPDPDLFFSPDPRPVIVEHASWGSWFDSSTDPKGGGDRTHCFGQFEISTVGKPGKDGHSVAIDQLKVSPLSSGRPSSVRDRGDSPIRVSRRGAGRNGMRRNELPSHHRHPNRSSLAGPGCNPQRNPVRRVSSPPSLQVPGLHSRLHNTLQPVLHDWKARVG